MLAALMKWKNPFKGMRVALIGGMGALGLLFALALPIQAQSYFGRNKVQYDGFDFKVLETPHFQIHYYPETSVAIEDVARMAERWYERYARYFRHEFEGKKPIVVYADHPDFQQMAEIVGQVRLAIAEGFASGY